VATITARYMGLILPSKMIWARDTKEMLSIWADRKRPTNDGDGFRRKRQNVGTQVPNEVCKNVHGIQMTLLMILLACETDGFRYLHVKCKIPVRKKQTDQFHIKMSISVANPHHIDAHPDPDFHFDADPDLTFQ